MSLVTHAARASGLALPLYEQQARYFGKQGFHVLLPHYFDATHSNRPTLDNKRKWVGVVDKMVAQCRQQPTTEQVFLLGFSLGASVALAAGSQGSAVEGIADWYGSLPDEFFFTMKTMPPLLILHGERDTNIPIVNGQQLVRLCEIKQIDCDHKFYPDQGHGFSGGALEDADRRTLDFFAAHSTRTERGKGPF